ncbi:MAG: S8 family serine peptidase, partial [Candidatus Eisenbacteria sp.]|nr:S8 family serine peptidase [Candidatus Eisenbacteria bacterium]
RTPDFTALQGYLGPAPDGVDAEGVWGIPGGRGQTVQVLDIEGAWLWEHEDLPDPFFTAGGVVGDLGWRNHGTAVAGEIRGTANGYGVSGISHEVQIGGVSIAELWVADAINTAAANLELGGIYLIELHAPGPNATGSGQFGYVCMEYWQDNFDAIQIATACGRICCEAAGNGEQDLDAPVYQGLFDRNVRDSGAIICGASNGSSLDPAWYTNYGSRVDLHGWGYSVVTCGYGDLQGGDEEEWYTESFAGTSSATPIVTGSVACIQGLVKDAFGICLEAKLARDILVDTGTPQTGSQHIGPRPNLTAAWSLAQNGVGAVYGVITDLSTGLPVQDVSVVAQETGAFTQSAADGSYCLPFLVGTYALDYDSFFYEPTNELVSVTSGDSTEVNVALVRRATAEITGRVLEDDAHTPLADVRVTPLDVPLPGTVTGPGGYWLLEGVPVDRTYGFLFDGLPLYGADFRELHVEEGDTAIVDFNVQLAHVAEDFELDDGGFTVTGDPIWAHGTPTAGGPASGFSGEKCWGVGMDDNYGDNVYGCLISPAFDFSGEEELLLSFHYWCETESGFDGANLQIWDAGTSDWVTLIPLMGYPTITMSGVGYESGWSGSTGGWIGTVFDLTDYISEEVTFRVQFGSDGGLNDLGFWVDDIAFDTGDVFSGVPETVLEVGFGIMGHAPNPLHCTTRITLALPSSGEVSVAVFDAPGRLIRTLYDGSLPAGRSELIWDGCDDRGALAVSGVYFIRMDANGRSSSRRVILTR